MVTNQNNLTPKESLDLIRSMIDKTKDSVANDSFYFLLWGWLVFVCCISSFILLTYFQYPNHYLVWLLMPIGGIVSGIYGSRQAKIKRVKTFVNDALKYLWLALGLAFIVLVIVNAINHHSNNQMLTYYILLHAIGTFVSGKMLQFRPLVIGGLINFALVIVSIHFDNEYQLLIGGLAVLTSYIIPGHLLRIKSQKLKS